MSNVKTLLMTGVAVLGLAAPVAAQSIGSDAGSSIGADASLGTDGATASADANSATGLTVEDETNSATANTDFDAGADAELNTDVAQDDSATDPAATDDTATNADPIIANSTKVGALIGVNVASSAGESIGEIDDVVDINGETMAVVGVGGFLGLGEHDVALPVTELMVEGNTVTAMGYTREQLKSMAEFNAEVATSLDAEQTIELGRS